ncbi:uncharacterized protein PHACADRAFT_264854 [Phanerochaete carnosa HHB-10118-sp]|uniref:Uncharacterized protein n=1 Tax=Phanerochaete carnosa (strain HHB-10118-sp) TaxID=650164 RepID=K5VTW4_PHACS|nr:uncharacterized protein PHACADRAFT_264854 [Phanerochaete carnosa HHB-10118-sp]EKM50235.1 hypothetical protein PHACADRAFT_264854 [Phanerochaete carnosa HHB-10118-sp]
MSLDQNLFTLNFVPGKDDPNVTELVDPAERPHYRKERVPGSVYQMNVYDPLSQSLLASATAPAATSKHKTIELHNPSHIVELKHTGTLTFKWRFAWEEHEFEWRREECFIIRKPDPAVLVAVTKEPSGRLKTSSVQILDYNLNRFDINDRKGLEIVILTALLTFQDSNEAYHTPSSDPPTPAQTSSGLSGFFGTVRRASDTTLQTLSKQTSEVDAPPPLPPKPEPRVGVERIAEVHAIRAAQGEGESNEVLVADEGTIEDYAKYAEGLLKDDSMLFATIRSASASEVPKVLQVVEHTKRLRHKAGLDEEQELYQYVVYATEKPKGPKRINLDGPAPSSHKAYTPPTSLRVHLSKIDMPELKPKPDVTPTKMRSPTQNPPPVPPRVAEEERLAKSSKQSKREEREREKERERERLRELEREKAQKKAEKEAQKRAEKDAKKNKKASSSNPEVNRLTRPHPTVVTSPSPASASPYSYGPPLSGPFHHAPPPRPASAFYGGSSFSSQMPPPPHHPATLPPRPSSFYGPGTFMNPYPGQNTSTPGFRPFLQP